MIVSLFDISISWQSLPCIVGGIEIFVGETSAWFDSLFDVSSSVALGGNTLLHPINNQDEMTITESFATMQGFGIMNVPPTYKVYPR